MLATLLALVLYQFLFPANQMSESEVKEVVAAAMASATPRTPDAVLVYQSIQPSLVSIESKTEGENGEQGTSLGTGVVIDLMGNIVTSLHVVDDSSDITVTFADGSRSDAFVLQQTPEMDIAILRAFNTSPNITPATMGNPGAMRVGDDVFVVGHPFGLYDSMSAGVISGFNRSFEPRGTDIRLTGLIQFDAAANPGNSGGPLLDRYGRVIGIVTGLVSPVESGYFVGIGFAVPINVAVTGGGGSPPY
jgi:S1-C subfamily serine protease